MAKSGSHEAAASTAQLFVRQASGLVRSVSTFDAFVYNLLWLNIGLGIAITFILVPVMFPGGNVLWAIAVATVFSAVHVAVWGLLAGAMPRSGGDYVFLSRLVHPLVGFLINWTVTVLGAFIIVLAAYLFVADGVATGLGIIGSVFGIDRLVGWSFRLLEPWPQFLTGAVAITVLAAIMIFRGLGYFRFQRVLFGIGLVGLLVAGWLLLMNSPASLSAGLDRTFGPDTVERTVAAARAAGMPEARGSFIAFMGAVSIALFSLPWAYASAWIGGEVRHPQTTQLKAMVGSVLVGGAAILVFGWLLISRAGEELLAASGWLFFMGEESPITAPPYYHLFPSVLTTSRVVVWFVVLAFIVWTLLWIPITLLSGSRNIFAWAFDRVVPEKLAEVDDRTNTPVIALSVVAALALVLWAVWAFTGVFFLTSFLVPSFFGLLVLNLAVIYGAFRRRELLERSPAALKPIAGIPLIAILAAIAALFFAVMVGFLLVDDTAEANTPAALITWAAVYASGTAIWFGARAYHRRKHGYDLAALRTELPPE